MKPSARGDKKGSVVTARIRNRKEAKSKDPIANSRGSYGENIGGRCHLGRGLEPKIANGREFVSHMKSLRTHLRKIT